MERLILGMTGSKTFEGKLKVKEFLFKIKQNFDGEIVLVSLGDLYGADRLVKKYALEFGYKYVEFNPPHTTKNLYSAMSESYYDRPFSMKNLHLHNKIFSQYVNKCVLFDDSSLSDKKILTIIKHLSRHKKPYVIVNS